MPSAALKDPLSAVRTYFLFLVLGLLRDAHLAENHVSDAEAILCMTQREIPIE